MAKMPPDGYPARQHPPPHQHYYPPHQQPPPPHQPPPPPPPHMYQAPQQPYYGAPMGAPPQQQPQQQQQRPPSGYYPPQYAHQPPPPGYAAPYAQPPQYYAQQPHAQHQQAPYPPNGGNTFPPNPASSAPMQYHMQYQQPHQPPPGGYPSTTSGTYAPPPPPPTSSGNYAPTSQANNISSSSSLYEGQYAPTSMGGANYSQQPLPFNQNSYPQAQHQQPYAHHQASGGYNGGSQSAMYNCGPSYNGGTTGGGGISGISGQGAMNNSGALMSNGSYPNASAPNLSPKPAMTQLCPSALPVIEGDPCRAPIKLRVEEKIMEASGDSFYITDYKKRPLYNVDGSRTPDQHKILKTAKGKPLLQMRQFSTVAKKIVISNMNGEAIATLQKQRVDSNTHKRIDGTLHLNSDIDSAKFIVAGNAQASSFKAENCREEVVAEITRASRSMKKIFSGQDSYTAEVSAGSPAFMVMVVVAIDEMYSDG